LLRGNRSKSDLNLEKATATECLRIFCYASKKQKSKTEEELTTPLYEEIGWLKMDIRWLERKL